MEQRNHQTKVYQFIYITKSVLDFKYFRVEPAHERKTPSVIEFLATIPAYSVIDLIWSNFIDTYGYNQIW